MTKRERIAAAIAGRRPDRPPVGFWMHFPGQDGAAESLAEATVAFQRSYDLDVVKLMPTGMFMPQAWGCEIEPDGTPVGTTRLRRSVIRDADDWSALPALDPHEGVLGEQVRVARLVRAALGDDVPVIATIFSPLTVAGKMAGARLAEHRAGAPRALQRGLEAIAETTRAFASAALDAGADGLFFATQFATRDHMSADEYERWGRLHDLRVLDPLAARSRLSVLHAHGRNLFFDLLARYPIHVINWHDRDGDPDLAEAARRTDKCLGGGVAREGAIVSGTPEQVRAEVRDAVAQLDGRRLIVMPGCTVPVTAPPANLHALRAAVDA